jgi:hypothetical protein
MPKIQFSLKEWEKQGKSLDCLEYRNGTKPLEVHYFEKNTTDFPLIAVMPNGICLVLSKMGHCTLSGNEHENDLFIVTPDEIKVFWANLYSNPSIFPSNWNSSKEKCDNLANGSAQRDGYIKLTKNITQNTKTIEIIPL